MTVEGLEKQLLMDAHIISFPLNKNSPSYIENVNRFYKEIMKYQSDAGDIPKEKIIQYHNFFNDLREYSKFKCGRDLIPKYENKMYDHMRSFTERREEKLYKELVTNDAALYQGFSKGRETAELPLIRYFAEVVKENE